MVIRFTSDRPIYLQFAQHVAEDVLSGLYGPGERLPSVREFAERYAVNPNTIQRALCELDAQGLVHAARGSGWYVTEEPAHIERARQQEARALAERYLADMRRLGFAPAEAARQLLDAAQAGTPERETAGAPEEEKEGKANGSDTDL